MDVSTSRQPAMSSRTGQQAVMADPDTALPLLTGGHILGDVAEKYGVSLGELTGRCQFPEAVDGRREAAYRLFHEVHLSPEQIECILNRHRTTVHYYLWPKVRA